MSANNQQQQADPSAAVAAPAASSEYLKRTCLICGCHTNQTINIYEPRSGPNIVQLIQAKFKFQPLNEDKFLCFSCNNWLINWHSLQAVNSNEAESQSQSPSHMGNSVVQQERTKLRPVAMVRPQVRVQPQSQPQPQPQVPVNPTPAPIVYSKRRPSSSRRSASMTRMSRVLRQCCLESLRRSPQKRRSQQSAVIVYLRPQGQKRSNLICKVECVTPRRKPLERTATKEVVASAPMPSNPIAPPTYQRFPQPSVDGKVVAMFRRLGTTLSREVSSASFPESTTSTTTKPPQIMSPIKEGPRWTRNLDEDEILLEFDSAISEVLPTTSYQVTQGENKENQRAEEMELEEEEDQAELEVVQEAEADAPLEPPSHRSSSNSSHHQNSHQVSLQLSGLRLPLGLSISLV
ncbi:protein phyllopod [Drosophila subpulchrella]|uniref:protein phyllopod n=1 Tax=Drosophila subpulchrella TaxID=1486046 RepID=UPI0018A18D08|nr:protein phyllopod [Drosophila subpulchrella]